MSIYPGFGGWINQNFQQRPKAESGRHESVESNSKSEKDTNLKPWYAEPGQAIKTLACTEEEAPWYVPPAKFKVKTKNGMCHMNIEFTVGLIPPRVYEMLTNPRNITFFPADERWRQRLENKSTKVLKKDGPRQITDVRKALRWKFLFFTRTIPIHLIIDENHQTLRVSITCGPNFESAMSIYPGFGGLINQNIQQPPKEESKRSENAKSNSESGMETNNTEDEEIKQLKLWSDVEKKHPWYDPPPKVKVTMKKGICHMKIELTLGVPPDGAYELFINPTNIPFFVIDKFRRQLLENKSRKVLKKDGPRQIVKVEKAVAWDFLWWSGALPISLIVDENKKDLQVKYKKEKMMFMKVFEGSWKIEPLYVDSARLCKQMKPKNREEYKKCSGGQGKIASKVTMDQFFQPYLPFNLPPLSWYIREITIKTTKTLLKMLQERATILREMPYS